MPPNRTGSTGLGPLRFFFILLSLSRSSAPCRYFCSGRDLERAVAIGLGQAAGEVGREIAPAVSVLERLLVRELRLVRLYSIIVVHDVVGLGLAMRELMHDGQRAFPDLAGGIGLEEGALEIYHVHLLGGLRIRKKKPANIAGFLVV